MKSILYSFINLQLLACTTPIDMLNSNDTYFATPMVDGTPYVQSTHLNTYIMNESMMKIDLYSANPVRSKCFCSTRKNLYLIFKATITSIFVTNPEEAQISMMTVDSDYDTRNATNQDSLRIDYQPNLEDNSDLTITLFAATSTTATPRNVTLAIYGCGQPSVLATKAQLEDRTSNPTTTGNSFCH